MSNDHNPLDANGIARRYGPDVLQRALDLEWANGGGDQRPRRPDYEPEVGRMKSDASLIAREHNSVEAAETLPLKDSGHAPDYTSGDRLESKPPTSLADQLPVESAEFEDQVGRLAALGVGSYEQERKGAAKRLGVRAPILDKLVEARRGASADSGKQGRAVKLPEPEPWQEPVDGAELLSALSGSIRSHVVMPDTEADTAALWILHTYLLDCFGISPRLAVGSPERGCGKTTLLDVISHLVWRPLSTSNATVAAIFRVVELSRPTLLIDEADTFLPENEELRGILNSGHRFGGSVIRTIGEDHQPRMFSTFCPCAIALIGKLPGTLADRSVSVELKRRRPDEMVARFRHDRTEHLDQLASQATRWAADQAERIRGANPEIPDGIVNRVEDNWRPLLAIADAAGGEWPMRARDACTAGKVADDDESIRVTLLDDIRAVFAARRADRISSGDLVEALAAIEERPWGEWKGKPITKNGLARLLKPFHIKPDTVRFGEGTAKGYTLAQFEDVFSRYLGRRGF
jgi:putative DNA primase/helicase